MNFVTFGSPGWEKSLERINGEAVKMNIFNKIFITTIHDLDKSFWEAHHNFVMTNRRGFGYWIWKSQVILQTLKRIPEGEILVYADAGCSLNVEGLDKLKEYGELAKQGPGILVFEMVGLECGHWTKMDCFQALDFHDYNSYQIMATAIIMVNNEFTRNFVQEWFSLCSNYQLLTDAPSIHPNHPSFKEHRHDQSIFNILARKRGCKVIKDETYFQPNWDQNKNYPIHARRWRS